MQKRYRKIAKILYLSEEEERVIKKNMEMLGTKNFSEYARKMLCDGYMIHRNFDYLKECTKELGYIARSLNSIARRANTTGNIYKDDLKSIALDYRRARARMTTALSHIIEEEKKRKGEKS